MMTTAQQAAVRQSTRRQPGRSYSFARAGALWMPRGKRVECLGGAGIAGSYAARGFGTSNSADPRTLSSASHLLAWWRAGNLLTASATLNGEGTSPPVVTWSGAGPVTGLRVEVNDVTGGTGRGQAKFRYSLLSGASSSWISGVTTAATVALIGADITLAFANGTYANNNVYEPVPTSWTDGFAGHALVQATTANAPRIRVNSIGSRVGLHFDGSDDFMLCTDSLANAIIGGSDKPFTALCVARVIGTVVDVIFAINNTAGTGFLDYGGQASAPFSNKKGDTDSNHGVTAGTLDTNAHVLRFVQSGTNAQCSIDTASQFNAAQNATTLTVDCVSVGATFINSVASNRGEIDLGDLWFYDTNLGAPELAEAEAALAAYYA